MREMAGLQYAMAIDNFKCYIKEETIQTYQRRMTKWTMPIPSTEGVERGGVMRCFLLRGILLRGLRREWKLRRC